MFLTHKNLRSTARYYLKDLVGPAGGFNLFGTTVSKSAESGAISIEES